MKIKILLLAVFLAPLFANAQYSEKNKVQLGFTTSPTFGWLTFPSGQTPPIEPDGMRTGFSYGVLADIPFSDNYYFSTALTVSTLNAKATEPGINTSVYKLQYLEVPLTLKLKSNEMDNRRFYGQFGLNTGINIGSKQDIVYTAPATPDEKNKDIGNQINTFRAGLIIGGGAEWKVGDNMNVLTGLSFSNGFTDVLDGNAKAKNSYIALNLGIFF
ncbi:porin family protein [Daejeonella oryzae]|uniref:porin family protein n=1 Tax=Daejeonella oryzae TaxID=1122943 RepID=UPI0003FD2A55|nr:porin family protein [Daejeonella oryzae]